MTNASHSRTSSIIVCIGFAAAILLASADTIKAEVSPTSDQSSVALITIPNPKEASLLQLRGYSGTGTALFRIDGQCHSMPVRLIAGDFGGRRIGLDRHGPIRLWITRSEIIQALFNGQDLVSEDFKVLAGRDGEPADIVIDEGLSAETGFVINPGRSVLADLFGTRSTPVPCSNLGLTIYRKQDR